MYGFTKSTPLDRTYRFSETLDTLTVQDEGAAVYLWGDGKPEYVGVVVKQRLLTPEEVDEYCMNILKSHA